MLSRLKLKERSHYTSYGRLRSTPYGRSHYTPYESSHSVFPPVPSQGKILNVLKGDCITPPDGRLRSTPYGRSRRTSNLETVRGGDRESIPGLKCDLKRVFLLRGAYSPRGFTALALV
ncbi:hypothetical protein [Cylindrospermopsis curvispora]|uniref:Uncharacterized protein n=1 Tax=Cylindrospermopsis curvispora GIHE-G1 TaxID=2666332 RepID=A0A7H0F5M2_9CYAN|nr:hypothetical protein [Cylindrospermopsis curvispora]QNP31338.1 hypothetical protein IAR63_17805 [Cylindrospermopsis curvispora GIHE-G1]